MPNATPAERAVSAELAAVAYQVSTLFAAIGDPDRLYKFATALVDAGDTLRSTLLDTEPLTPLRATLIADLTRADIPATLHHLVPAYLGSVDQ